MRIEKNKHDNREERTRHCPLSLLNHSLDSLDDTWVSFGNILRLKCIVRKGTFSKGQRDLCQQTHRQLIERTSFLNVGQSLLERLQLNIDLILGLLGLLDLTTKTKTSVQYLYLEVAPGPTLTAFTSNVSMTFT